MADTPPPQSPLSYNAHQPPSLSSIASIHGNDPRGPSSRRSSLLLKSDATPLDVGHEDPGLSLHLGFELTPDRLRIDFGSGRRIWIGRGWDRRSPRGGNASEACRRVPTGAGGYQDHASPREGPYDSKLTRRRIPLFLRQIEFRIHHLLSLSIQFG